MRFELDLIRDLGRVRPEAPQGTTSFRRAVREITDSAVHDALLMNSRVGLAATLTSATLAIAEGLTEHSKEPVVEDFVAGTIALIESARTVLDRGLLLTDWPQALQGACMIEIVVRGALACVGIPYEAVAKEITSAIKEARESDIAAIIAPLDTSIDKDCND